MSIHGVLEDLPLADVLQFIHLGRRTGTLYLWREDDRRAEIGFHDGRIISAWTPGQRRLGDQMVEDELIDQTTLDGALAKQRSDGAGQSIGKILLEEEVVTRDQIHAVIKEQIQETIFDLITWKHGNFHFEVDELAPLDDFAVVPGELLDDLDLNTQMLLLEATRIFDERQRGESVESELDRRLQRAGMARPGGEDDDIPIRRPIEPRRREIIPVLRLQVVSDDDALRERLIQELPEDRVRVVSVRLREAGTRVPGEAVAPIVVLDQRGKDIDEEEETVSLLGRTRPGAPVIILVDDANGGLAERAVEAGAVAVVDDTPLLVASCRNLMRVLGQPLPQIVFGPGLRGGLSGFRRVVFDVQSGLLSATMALNLMHVISESVERAVLFLVQGNRMVAVGAFGFSQDGRPLAEVTRGLKLVPEEGSVLWLAVDEAKTQNVNFDDARLPDDLGALLGRPASDQVVIFPVLGAERAISVIYTDNGEVDEEIQDIKILELATAQVGVAFENELLRQQLDGRAVYDVFRQGEEED
ncbi:MAG: DUF4388 domain-containing protein [Acidobacteriota bacterium]